MTLAAGADRTGVDIHVAVARFGRIDGVVSGIEDTPANQVVLRPRGNTTTGAVLFSPTARAGADGKFNFTNVPPGEYTIIARVLPLANDPFTGDVRRGNTLWATTDVTMNSDNQRVIMRWRPGLTVSGRVTFDGESRPPDDIIVRVGIRPTPSSSGPPAPDAVPIKDDGTFTINGVMPGSYRLYVLVPPMAGTQIPQWIPASAMIDGHDAFDDAFAVRPDLGSPEIPVVLTRETQQIDGTLRDNAGRPVPNCPVVVSRRRGGSGTRSRVTSRCIERTKPAGCSSTSRRACRRASTSWLPPRLSVRTSSSIPRCWRTWRRPRKRSGSRRAGVKRSS